MNRRTITILSIIIWAFCCGLILGALINVAVDEPETDGEQIQAAATEIIPQPEPEILHTPEPVVTVGIPEVQETPEPEPTPVRIMQGEYTITAYCSCQKCCGYWATVRPLDENGEPIVYTATGTIATQGRTIAVDPEVFEFGTEVWLDGPWGEQCFIAEDILGGASGKHIDIYFDNHEEARQWGLQTREVWLYAKEDDNNEQRDL